MFFRPPAREQTDIALTYASDRFISYRETGHEQWGHRDAGGIARGQAIDLPQGTAFGIRACPDTDRRYGEEDPDDYEKEVPSVREGEWRYDAPRRFIFGSLIYACDPEVYAAFRALIGRHARMAVTRNGQGWAGGPCARWTRRLLVKEFESPVLPVLTPNGLALHGFQYNSFYLEDLSDRPWLTCPSGARSGDPVVIPYRELEPFMTNGPLKNELLAVTR